MAFMRYAKATVIHPHVSPSTWRKNKTRVASHTASVDLIAQASDIFESEFNPDKYLLTHATIVASVDTEVPPNTEVGSFKIDGFKVNRKFPDYRVTLESERWINHNNDGWDRKTLLASYKTFVGGHNFVEHVQIEDLSKGRIIDAVARDIGPSVYIDILIATDRKHKDLVASIESGEMSTLSMGCFVAGTQVTMADGRRIAIEDVQPGDMVLTHKGRSREVLNKQIRYGTWNMRTIHAVGQTSPIKATSNHPLYVLRPSRVCACGCGEDLEPYKSSVKQTTRAMSRRFKRGHDKRILNPNNTYSLEEFRERKARMDAIQSYCLEKVRAEDLREGDFLAFPRVKDGEHTVDVTEGKARLLGYFLAEGSFNKQKGQRTTVVFSFSMEEKETFVAEVVRLLEQEFPGKNKPWVQDREKRNTCVVHLTSREAADWFYEHGGEYSHGKRLSAEVMNWSMENHKHLIGTWFNGDGHRAKAHGGFLVGVTVSFDLACQLHALMAKCGLFARFETSVRSRSVTVEESINGGLAIRDEATGRLPAFSLVIGNTQSVDLQGYCAKAPTSSKFTEQNFRTFEDWIVTPITKIENWTHQGWVYDMEVEEDHTYIAEGAVASNCTVDFTICTKCGHVAHDETEMCFPTGTRVLKADGKYAPIEELVEGDLVITHTGAVQQVLHTMGRHYTGNVTVLNIEGVPQPVRATTGHRFWVLRPETHCQCGCGKPLHRTIEHERGSVKAFQRRFLPGHYSKVWLHNRETNLITLEDYHQVFETKLGFVPAKEIRKGDYLAFPIPQQVQDSADASINKARLIGYFLAEGSFIKRNGQRVGVSFDFGSHEHDTLAAEVEELLNKTWGREERRTISEGWQAKVASKGIKPIRRRKTSRTVPTNLTCPACGAPSEYAYNVRFKKGLDDCYQCKVCKRQWIEGAERAVKARRNLTGDSGCTVRLMCPDAAEWFYRYCGEYAAGKMLPPEVMYWPQDVQKHILFGWLGGDGTQSRMGITGNTASFDLMSQMHLLAARCGWYSRKQVTFDRRAAVLDEVVNGSGPVTIRDSNGWLTSFSLTLSDPGGFGGEVRFTDPENARVTMSSITDGFKRVGNYLLYRVRDAWNECYSGLVHNIEVAGDKSYVVEGVAVHNCAHIKYEKGNTYIDEQGHRRKIAELCGHHTVDPTGGVRFIEASWVKTPAFTGAVMRNILTPTPDITKQAEKILSTPPPQWSTSSNVHVARARSAEFDFGDEGDSETPAEEPKKNPLDETEEELTQHMLERVKRRIKKQLEEKDQGAVPYESTTAPNDNIQRDASEMKRTYVAAINAMARTASSDTALMEAVAEFHNSIGTSVPVSLYRAALKVGSCTQYDDSDGFRSACREALGREPTKSEFKTLVGLGQILSRRQST